MPDEGSCALGMHVTIFTKCLSAMYCEAEYLGKKRLVAPGYIETGDIIVVLSRSNRTTIL